MATQHSHGREWNGIWVEVSESNPCDYRQCKTAGPGYVPVVAAQEIVECTGMSVTVRPPSKNKE